MATARPFTRLFLAACGSMALALPAGVSAQAFPTKPMRIVIGFPAGGPADFAARTVAQKMGELSGQTVIVDNRAGAAGMIAAELVARGPADGHTMFLSSSGALAFHTHLYAKAPVDPFKDFAPVTQAIAVPEILVVHPSVPVKTVKELVALARSRPGKLSFASAGSGGMPHLVGEAFNMAAGVKIVHVPYKGAAPAVTDVLGGQVEMTFLDIPVLLPHIRANKLRALAIATEKRSPVLPDLMTMGEAGYPTVLADNWYGMVVAAGTPRDILMRLHALVVKALHAPETRERFASMGAQSVGNSPEEFLAFWRAESDRWGKIIRAVGIKLD